MAKSPQITHQLPIPSGVTVTLGENGHSIKAAGKAGKVERIVKIDGVKAKVAGSNIEIIGNLREANTLRAHFANVLEGVQGGYKRKLKIVYAHFPFSLEVKGKDIIIKNFLGEKQPRHADLIGQTKLEIKGADVMVNGVDIEEVGQTIANIRQATRIRSRDSRVFQDGVYPVEL